jgi:hypothetical protein
LKKRIIIDSVKIYNLIQIRWFNALNLNIIYIRALIVSSRLAVIIRICDAILLTFFLKISIMIEYLPSNSRFTFSALIIYIPANSSAYIIVPAILSNLSNFLLAYSRARLREIFSFLNTARIFYNEFDRFPAPISVKILFAAFRLIIIIPIYVFITEKFVLKFIITFWLRRSRFWLIVSISLTRFRHSLETKIILFIIIEILPILPFIFFSWFSREEIFS